jgi:hypothetical protein
MKIKLFILTIALTILNTSIYAQKSYIEISGKQKIYNGNLNFEGQKVYISQPCHISSFNGLRTSFSLRKENSNPYQFYYSKGKFKPAFDSVIIEPGVYILYPDLPEGKDSIEIKIKLKALKNPQK